MNRRDLFKGAAAVAACAVALPETEGATPVLRLRATGFDVTVADGSVVHEQESIPRLPWPPPESSVWVQECVGGKTCTRVSFRWPCRRQPPIEAGIAVRAGKGPVLVASPLQIEPGEPPDRDFEEFKIHGWRGTPVTYRGDGVFTWIELPS